jgi:hypothetical protein
MSRKGLKSQWGDFLLFCNAINAFLSRVKWETKLHFNKSCEEMQMKTIFSSFGIGTILKTVMVLALLFVFVSPTQGGATGLILYVKPSGLISGSCDQWANACDLQYALNSIATPGSQIWAVQGTYKPTSGTDQTISFTLKDQVSLYGGFVGTETALNQRNPVQYVTILSGDIGAAGTITDNTYHVVVGSGISNSTILDGFTIIAGNAIGSSSSYYWTGGGMYLSNSSPTITNIIFKANRAIFGGGMYNFQSNPTITNVTFESNSAPDSSWQGYGGGICNSYSNPALSNVTFTGNTSVDSGGGMMNSSSSPVLTNVTFTRNTAALSVSGAVGGGGIFNDGYSNPSLTNVTFNGNSASDGGGMMTYGKPVFKNVLFINNAASFPYGAAGGGMFNGGNNVMMVNVTFQGNTATGYHSNGGGLSNVGNDLEIIGSTFAANHGGAIFNEGRNLIITNSTFYRNTGGAIYNLSASPLITNTTFFGNSDVIGGAAIINWQGSKPRINDSIFWGDLPSEILNSTSYPIINDSLISGGCPIGSTCTHILIANPYLDALQNNGGFAQTMALSTDSPAIDAGNNSTCAATDERGIRRPQGPKCDLGAYEYAQPTLSSTPRSWNYGLVKVGTTSSGKVFTIKNTGSANLVIGTVSLTGSKSIQFYITGNTCSGVTLHPDGTCTITAVFKPRVVGIHNMNIKIQDNAFGHPHIIMLSGQGD